MSDDRAWRWGVRGGVLGSFAVALGGIDTYASASWYAASVLGAGIFGFLGGLVLSDLRRKPIIQPESLPETPRFSRVPPPVTPPYDWSERTKAE